MLAWSCIIMCTRYSTRLQYCTYYTFIFCTNHLRTLTVLCTPYVRIYTVYSVLRNVHGKGRLGDSSSSVFIMADCENAETVA